MPEGLHVAIAFISEIMIREQYLELETGIVSLQYAVPKNKKEKPFFLMYQILVTQLAHFLLHGNPVCQTDGTTKICIIMETSMFLSMSYKTMRVPLDELFTLGQPNSLTLLPQCGFEILNLTLGKNIISIKASLAVRISTSYRSTTCTCILPLVFPTIPLERCRFVKERKGGTDLY